MANEQILKKAIERAEKNGFNIEIFWWRLMNPDSSVHPSTRDILFIDENIDVIMKHLWELLLNHDFAKAFWGEKIESSVIGDNPAWMWHLCKMVLEKEPLKYLEKFLK